MNSFKKKIIRFFQKAYTWIIRLVFGVDKNKVLFVSFEGKGYSDNPKAICEELIKLDIDNRLDIIWAYNYSGGNHVVFPKRVRLVDIRDKLKYYKEMATARAVVNNFNYPHISKGKTQFFIQTWHGDRGFKKTLYDSPFAEKLGIDIAESKPGFCDLAIAGSDFLIREYRSAFRYQGEILRVGSPRNDILVRNSEDEKAKIKQALGIEFNNHILLYAPTLRRKNQAEGTSQRLQNIDIEHTLDVLTKKTGKSWICLIRSHPDIRSLEIGNQKSNRIINVSKYDDMADILLISDLLITDYSSSAGDFPVLNRPTILFQDDYDSFLENDRSFYFDISTSPYLVAHNQSELDKVINNLTEDGVIENCKKILEFFGAIDNGNASQIVANRIFKLL